jgi:hypothetical protein
MSQPLAVFAELVEYIDASLAEAREAGNRSNYPAATGRLAGAMRAIKHTLALMTAERAFDHIYDDPSTLLLERISTDLYGDSIAEFFDNDCLEAAADFVDDEVLESSEFQNAFVVLATRRWSSCPRARERMIDDTHAMMDTRDRFMDGYGHRRDTTIAEWCNEITDESFITEVVALMTHRTQEHLKQVAAWRDDPHNPANEDSEPSLREETHVRAAS